MKLTKTEIEILQHRLDVPDAITDALCTGNEKGNSYNEDAIVDAIDDLELFIRLGGIKTTLNNFQKVVLVELLEGSTWVATHYDNVDDKTYAAAVRSLRGLIKKVEGLTGQRVQEPTLR